MLYSENIKWLRVSPLNPLYTVKKNKWKVRNVKVRDNRFCQFIVVWSNFLRLKITQLIKVKFSPS